MSKERLEKELLFTQESLYRVHQENKHYREALERIAQINIEDGTVTVSEVHAVLTARKALESESDE